MSAVEFEPEIDTIEDDIGDAFDDVDYIDEPDTEDEAEDDDEADADEEEDGPALPPSREEPPRFQEIEYRTTNRVMDDTLNKFEISAIVANRAKDIAKNGLAFVDTDGETDPIKIAKKELVSRRCPLLLHRHNGEIVEIWNPNEMGLSLGLMD